MDNSLPEEFEEADMEQMTFDNSHEPPINTNQNGDGTGPRQRHLFHQCKECGIFCATRMKLLRHCHLRHPNVWNLQCHLCNQLFARQCMLSRHLAKSHQIRNKPQPLMRRIQMKNEFGQYCCGEAGCEQIFETRRKLLRHNQIEHRDVWNLQCHLCSLFFKHKGNFARHLKNSHGQGTDGAAIDVKPIQIDEFGNVIDGQKGKKRQNECTACELTFENQVKMWQHLAVYHYDVYKYECILCKRVFKVEKALKVHLRKIHGLNIETAEASGTCTSYSCGICVEKFADQKMYHEHCRMHVLKDEPKGDSTATQPYYVTVSGEHVVGPILIEVPENLDETTARNASDGQTSSMHSV